MSKSKTPAKSSDDGSTAPPSRSGARSIAVNFMVLTVTLILLLGVVELTLRITDFRFVLTPSDIEFGRPDPLMLDMGFEQDDDLFWVPKGYGDKLARLSEQRPPLVLLGDSCTHLGRYDERLAELTRRTRGAPLNFGNLAVVGWSSYQGRRQMERDVPALQPKVVTIYFGWNDHWIGFGLEDRTVAQVKRIFSSRWSHLRGVQLLTKATVAYRAGNTDFPNRVSLADFEDNLTAMVTKAREIDAVPVIITAASNHVRGKEPKSLKRRWLRDLDELVPLHQSYVEVQRRVAGESGAVLCDLEAEFSTLDPEVRKEFFMRDGIHFRKKGNRRVAEALDQCFEREQLWPLILEP